MQAVRTTHGIGDRAIELHRLDVAQVDVDVDAPIAKLVAALRLRSEAPDVTEASSERRVRAGSPGDASFGINQSAD